MPEPSQGIDKEKESMVKRVMNTHTEGPWTYRKGPSREIVASNGTMVAIPHGPDGEWLDVQAEHHANAYLIAAAPTLLEELRKLLYTPGNGVTPESHLTAVAAVRDATR